MKKQIFIVSFVSLFVCLFMASAIAQHVLGYMYSINFVCGEPDAEQLVKGNYLTAISVHNPTDQQCYFEKMFSVAFPFQKTGPVTDFIRGGLGPYQSMEIDCPEIRYRLEQIKFKAEFIKGFVLIKSDVKLNVTAIYSAAGDGGVVESLHVETITPSCNSDDSNGSDDPNSGCESIPKDGQQCFWRVSKDSRFDIKKRECGEAYKCGTGETRKCKTEAIFTLKNHQDCDESSAYIPDSSILRVAGDEIIRNDASAVFTGTFDLFNIAGNLLGKGDVTILSKVGTHRIPLKDCEKCDPEQHSEGFLCGKVMYQGLTYLFYCQIALNGWYPQGLVRQPTATFEGALVM